MSGGWKDQTGENHPACALKGYQVDEMRRLRGEGLKLRELEKIFGYSQSGISRILSGQRHGKSRGAGGRMVASRARREHPDDLSRPAPLDAR